MVAIWVLLGIPFSLYAQESPTGIPNAPESPLPFEQPSLLPVEKVSPGVFQIGDIRIEKKGRSVSFPALINMEKGLLEYLLVHSSGKTHESLFRTPVQPYDLQIAFLLLGFEGSDNPISFQGAPEKPEGERVKISVSYEDEKGKVVKTIPEKWMINRRDDKEEKVRELKWVFTGSSILNGRFLAQIEGSIVAVFRDPAAIVDNASEGGETDKIWFVNENTVPPVGTPVTLTIKAK
jgi:hypothetical protein